MAIKSTKIIQELETKISVEKEKLYVLELKEKIEVLTQQRDALLAACEKAFEESHNPKVEKILDAAIANCQT